MAEKIQLGEIEIAVTRKEIRHVHLSVHPPNGRVTLVAPRATRPEVARAYAISKLGWIRNQQAKLRGQARETSRRYVERESHYLWGRRYLLTLKEAEAKPSIRLDDRRIVLTVRPGAGSAKCQEVVHEWHKSLLHDALPALIRKWEPNLGVKVAGYFLQRMKTKWGSCNHRARNIRLNTELVKKPKDLLEYVVVHEMIHLIAPAHSEKFLALMRNTTRGGAKPEPNSMSCHWRRRPGTNSWVGPNMRIWHSPTRMASWTTRSSITSPVATRCGARATFEAADTIARHSTFGLVTFVT
jgi:predicted metal-dependent hydrolase